MNREKRHAAARSGPPESHVGRPRGSPGRRFARLALLAALSLLTVLILPSALPPAQAEVTGGTVNAVIGASGDDGYWSIQFSTFFAPTDTTVFLGGDGASGRLNAWLRFTGITVPQGATVDVANLTINPVGTGSEVNVRTRIYANAADDAVAPTSRADADGKALTANKTDGVDSVNMVADVPVTFSVIPAVQDVVNRSAWVDGNALMIIWVDDGSTTNVFYAFDSFDQAGGTPAALDITWTLVLPPAPAPPTFNQAIFGVFAAIGIVVIGLGFFNLVTKKDRRLEDLAMFLVLILFFAIGASIAVVLVGGG